MPDRLVYLVEEVTPQLASAPVEFVDAAGLAGLLSDGYEASTTLENQQVKVGSKKVKATMFILKQASENRGVSVRPRGGDDHAVVSMPDGFGGTREVSLQQAQIQVMRDLALSIGESSRQVGHLGAPGRHSMPGLTIISGEVISKAFDLGQLAAASGKSKEANPFPPGSEASTKWLQGFKKGASRHSAQEVVPEGVSAQDHEKQWKSREDAAHEQGRETAQSLDADDVAHNPHIHAHPRIRDAWVRGFVAGGGTVE
jgi:ribosome modulation factor